MPFLPPNQQRQSTEGTTQPYNKQLSLLQHLQPMMAVKNQYSTASSISSLVMGKEGQRRLFSLLGVSV